jgi:RHS repeat-associated protein
MKSVRRLVWVLCLAFSSATQALILDVTATPISGSRIDLSISSTETIVCGAFIYRNSSYVGFAPTPGSPSYPPVSWGYSDTGLSPGTYYTYLVVPGSWNDDGNYCASYQEEDGTGAAATTLAPPTAPSSLSASAASGTQINVYWSDNSGNESYFKLERKTGSGGSWSQIATPSANATSYGDSGLSNGTDYYYRVRAFGNDMDSGYSNESGATTHAPPAAPSSLGASAASGTQINLTWSDNSGNETGFKIERKTGSGGSWSQIDTVGANATSYNSTGLANGTEYYYRVRATNATGDSGYSNEASATTASIPAAPSSLGASAVSGTQINLTWTDNSGNETGFKLERKTGSGGSWSQIATPAANATSYNDTGLANGTEYYYRLRATNTAGDSSYSSEANASTWGPPGAPSALNVTPASGTQLNLTWNDNSGNETGFKVERKTESGGSWSEITTTAANATGYNDTGLSGGTTYYYRVRATNSVGDSSYTDEASALVPVPPAAPSALKASPTSGTVVDLTWTDNSSNETGFKIERKTGSGGSWSEITTTSANATSYSDTGRSTLTAYYYRIRATNLAGDSAYSSETATVTQGATNVTNGSIAYTYDHFGNLLTTVAGGVTTTLEYDLRGRKTRMIDADMGTWTYQYNAAGELVWQCDPVSRGLGSTGSPADCTTPTLDGSGNVTASGTATLMKYDLLGRMTKRYERDLISTWTWDSCTKGVGKLCSVASDNDYSRTQAYDSTYGRPTVTTTTIGTGGGSSHAVTTAYDAAGRVQTITYPDSFAVKQVYNAYGYLAEVRNNADNALFSQVTAMSASGRVTTEVLGNGQTTTRTYGTTTQRLDSVVSTGTGGTRMNLAYTYDAIGNVTQRADSVNSVTENYTYDSLNRLKTSSGSGLVTRVLDYDAMGNIVYKSDVGSYSYGSSSSRPHAVASVSGVVTASYSYDANGNLASGAGRTLTYTSFNMPATISQGSNEYTYTYGADHQRVKQVLEAGSDTTTTIYVHPNGAGSLLYEKITRPDSVIEYRHYVNGPAGLVGAYITQSSYGSGEAAGMRYYHRDLIDSIVAISNDAGAEVEGLGYEAFGKRRYVNGTADPGGAILGMSTERGFTSHEHLDEVQLVHMNGRVFDPLLGRFMTADPFIQSPGNLQSYNRYTYGWNNPLIGTDPSGHIFNFIERILDPIFDAGSSLMESRAIFGLAAGAWIVGGAGLHNLFGSGTSVAFKGGVGGFSAGLISSDGDLRAAVTGGITGSMFGWAKGLGDPGSWEVLAGHALAGCVGGALAAGDCSGGALGAVAGKTVSNALWDGKPGVGEFVATTVSGGAASSAVGGKFANGAVTAAFGYLFNQAAMLPGAGSGEAALLAQQSFSEYVGAQKARIAEREWLLVDPAASAIESVLFPWEIVGAQSVSLAVRGVAFTPLFRELTFACCMIFGPDVQFKKNGDVRTPVRMHTLQMDDAHVNAARQRADLAAASRQAGVFDKLIKIFTKR